MSVGKNLEELKSQFLNKLVQGKKDSDSDRTDFTLFCYKEEMQGQVKVYVPVETSKNIKQSENMISYVEMLWNERTIA